MLQRPIPATGELLPVIGLGTYQAFDVDDRGPEVKLLVEVMTTLSRLGGTVVDSSPMYGRAEAAVGAVAQGARLRDRMFYATKV